MLILKNSRKENFNDLKSILAQTKSVLAIELFFYFKDMKTKLKHTKKKIMLSK